MTKPTKWHVRLAKTQISLAFCHEAAHIVLHCPSWPLQDNGVAQTLLWLTSLLQGGLLLAQYIRILLRYHL